METKSITRPWWHTLECSAWANSTEVTKAYLRKMRVAKNEAEKLSAAQAMKIWSREKN